MPQKSELPKWVFWSTRESIDNDIPSVTAIFETLVAVPLYWWIAVHFESYLPIVISAVVAPLVLLRSDRSVMTGVGWFIAWETSSRSDRGYRELQSKERQIVWVIGVLSVVAIGFISFLIGRNFLLDVGGWTAFGIGFVFGCVAIAAAGSLIVATEVPVTRLLRVETLAAGEIAVLAGLAGGVSSAVGLGLGSARYEASGGVLAAIPTTFPIFLGIALGILLVSLAIRVGATIRYIGDGLRSLPSNFRRLTLCISPWQEPELVPGVPSDASEFTVSGFVKMLRRDRNSKSTWDKVFAYAIWPIVMVFLFFPAWFYRVTLKSTAWFWWPLAFLGDNLQRAKHPELFRQSIMETLLAKVSIALALATILAFLVSNLLLSGILAGPNPFLSVLGFLFVVDWKSLGIWQILAITAAVLSIAILLWADSLGREYQYARTCNDQHLLAAAERKFGWIERLVRLRLLLAVGFWLIVGSHTLLLFNSYRCWFNVPSNVERWAGWIYDKRMPGKTCFASHS